MTYKEIETYLNSPENIEKILEYCQENYFNRVDFNAEKFINDVLSSPDDINKVLDELTGIYMNLTTIYTIASTVKDNEELKYYNKRRNEIEQSGKKFLSSSTDKESSYHVSNYRRVRNILESYILKCSQGISVCQTKLKYLSIEFQLSK